MRDRTCECPEKMSRLYSEEAEPSLLSVSRPKSFGAANLEAFIRPITAPIRFKKLGYGCPGLSEFSCYLAEFSYSEKLTCFPIFDSGYIILRSLRSSCIPLGDVSRSSPSIYFCCVFLIVENSSVDSTTGVSPYLPPLGDSSSFLFGVTPRRPLIISVFLFI